MARKSIEKNIAYDDEKKLYYINLDYGKDENGRRIKKTKTFSKVSEARKALREFDADKIKGTIVKPKKVTLKEWLDYWMNEIVTPNRQYSTIYGYQQIIVNHIAPGLGEIPLQELNLCRYKNIIIK